MATATAGLGGGMQIVGCPSSNARIRTARAQHDFTVIYAGRSSCARR